MRIELLQLQTRFELDEHALERYVEWIMHRVRDLDDAFTWTELSLVLTDDTIRDLNREWFGIDVATDVISFAYPDDALGAGDTGEVIVNVQRAREEGSRRGSPDAELALYIAHGCHHLTGAEDDTPERKRAMLDLEDAWVREADTLNLCGPFFR